MEAKLLNLPEALKLASLVVKYIEPGESPQESLDFVSSLLDKIDPMEYLSCIRLLCPFEISGQEGGQFFLDVFFSGLEKNKIITLIDTYRRMGFV